MKLPGMEINADARADFLSAGRPPAVAFHTLPFTPAVIRAWSPAQ